MADMIICYSFYLPNFKADDVSRVGFLGEGGAQEKELIVPRGTKFDGWRKSIDS